jgi:hypothetical protein
MAKKTVATLQTASKRLSKAHESMKKILGDDFLDF